MNRLIVALILWGAFSWSNTMAQTQEQGHKHEQHQEEKEVPAKKDMSMKAEMKEKMKEKMKDMKCCPKEEQKEPKS
jgi:cytoskeletal protein RodZ